MPGKQQDYTDRFRLLYNTVKNIPNRRMYIAQELSDATGINKHMIKKILLRLENKYPGLIYKETSSNTIIYDMSSLIELPEYHSNVITL